MPGALLLSPSGSNGQRRARQKPGGLTSIQGAQEAGRRGPWVTAWRGRPACSPGASDAGRGRQRGGASRGAMAAAHGECACARRCDPEVAPCAPEVAPRGPRRSGRSPRGSRPLLPESPREPSGAGSRPGRCRRSLRETQRPPGSGRAQRGCGPRLPRRFPGAVLFFGPSWKQRPSRAPVPPADRAPLAHPASWSSLLEHVLSTGAKPSNKEVSSQEQHLQEGPGCWCRRSGSRFNRTLRFVPPRLVSLLEMFVRIICRPWPQAGDTRAFRSQGKGRINCVLYCML
ncbi:testican-3 isoform X2 [Oryctolagus cuniculus]|uniref:testican-3 isoform X2 n=1 Tax=Oryctolagus cuniculus TaxID=9986 RepID=UPI003879103A